MEYRRLGKSGLSVSEISLGNWITHGEQIDKEAAFSCIQKALDLGINTFDTADVYAGTKAEHVLGKAIKSIRRESIVLCTKVYFPTGSGPNDRGLSRKHIMEACHGSLRRLQTSYIDVYYAHRFDETVPIEETMLAFADLVRQGKVLYIGVSEWTADQIKRGAKLARELRIPLIANQPQYSMLWRVIEKEVIPACFDEGLGQMVWSPLAQGILTGKYQPGATPPKKTRATDPKGKRFFEMAGKRWMDKETLTAIQQLRPIAQEQGLTLAQLALAWVLQNSTVSSCIIGASRPEQIEENVKASGVKLSNDVMKTIDQLIGEYVVYDVDKNEQ